jgi:hypothetical protein
LDAELPLYIKYQKELAEIGIKTFLPDLESFELRNKNRLAKLSKELNLTVLEELWLWAYLLSNQKDSLN